MLWTRPVTDTNETYVLIDIETDGFSPGHYSMLSFAAVAFKLDKTILTTFERNLETLPGAKQHPQNMQFWAENPEAWAACRKDPVPPQQAMRDFYDWAKALPGDEPAVVVAHPASFDHAFIYWYFEQFVGGFPFHFAGLDMASYAMAILGTPYAKSSKQHMPPHWIDPTPHTHVAMDDAIGHAMTFCNMAAAAARLRGDETLG